VALHEARVLLPDADDRLRVALERNARLLAAARADVRQALEDASARPEHDVAIRFAGLVDARLFVSAAGDEVGVAIATRTSDGGNVEEQLRDLLFAIAFEAAQAEISEPRADWPSGPLEWSEVARLGLREPPQ
jgi:hypothetical protein